jgi:hypothetical protein
MPPDDGDAANVGHLAVAVGGNLLAQQGRRHLADDIRGLLMLQGWRDDSGGLDWDGFLCARQSSRRIEPYAGIASFAWAAHPNGVTDKKAACKIEKNFSKWQWPM